jgi:hypothetical protein
MHAWTLILTRWVPTSSNTGQALAVHVVDVSLIVFGDAVRTAVVKTI